ncbi:N-acetylglucosamine kinase [Streptomyces sp. AK02-01A]|uniref:N-acetylglucosamine kinase n=1 Tax=Streptomyces sp. AK02-01A TaxID=3028648 RepID=UPI0029ADAFDE|nr:BadF/BadG/BcrA/BcrD ATPase family protein [Streptomyces sp. AK02-01A]MDX3854745.1 BadF/BadG/BcrA/BcrD ATPase family protein [Streptomyces sp. AK02-01A]
MSWVLGVDSGGSGVRIALGSTAPTGTADSTAVAVTTAGTIVSTEPVRTGPTGIDAGHLLGQLLPAAQALLARSGADALSAVAIGAAGMATLGDGLRAELPMALERALGVRRLALAADAVTAYAGALGQRPGAVVAAGTGMIALGTDLRRWRRADGWGHLLGDCGSGAWIGRAGLEAAMRAYDGRRGGSTALLSRMELAFGPAMELPGLLYPRTDRPAVLASFAPEVARCAADDPVAEGILATAARHIAEAAAAVCPPSVECEVALTGGLFELGDPLLVPLRAELTDQLRHATTVSAAHDPLAGALLIAAALATDSLRLPQDPRMLNVPTQHDR